MLPTISMRVWSLRPSRRCGCSGRARGDARADSDADLALLLGSGAPVPSLHVQGHRDATWPGLDDFVGAVDLAVARAGTIYVADLFAGTISGVRHGRSRVVAEVPSPGAVEIGPPGTLCATTGVFTEGDETGQLVQIAWRRP